MADTTAGNIGVTPLDTVRAKRTILGHPAGLFVLFFTEMWERFSYYGMRALLVLYMVDYLIKGVRAGTIHVFGFMGIQHALESVFGPMPIQPLSSEIYGLYTGLVYFTPFFGGLLADRVLGQRKTVVVGGVLMAIGHFLMAVESMFLVALVFLIILASDRQLMGRWANSPLYNSVAIAIVGFVSLCGAAYAIDAFLQTVHVL